VAYYDELARASDRARRVGWESLAMQERRFACVATHVSEHDAVLDLSAGLGDLGSYLRLHGHRGAYLGIERDPALLALAHADVRAGDLFACEARADVVVAIGALVDGSSLHSDGVRYGRLRRLLEVARACASRLAIVIVAKQEAIEARPVLAADEALGGMRAAELAWLAPDATLIDLSDVDWALTLPGAA